MKIGIKNLILANTIDVLGIEINNRNTTILMNMISHLEWEDELIRVHNYFYSIDYKVEFSIILLIVRMYHENGIEALIKYLENSTLNAQQCIDTIIVLNNK